MFSIKRVGDYYHLTVVADGIAERTKPGNFVALAVGGETSGALLRRAFSIYRVRPAGVYGGTVEIVFAAHGKGTQLAGRAASRTTRSTSSARWVDPFALPKEPVACALVGGGYGSAPLFVLAERLRERGCAVHIVLGAATESQAVRSARGQAGGPVGHRDDGRRLGRHQGPGHRPAAGPDRPAQGSRSSTRAARWACCAAVTEVALEHGAWSQTAVEESMACGIGVCMTCVLPVVGDDGVTRMVRSCVEGPVFAGDQVRWDAVGTIPPGTHGAPQGGGH